MKAATFLRLFALLGTAILSPVGHASNLYVSILSGMVEFSPDGAMSVVESSHPTGNAYGLAVNSSGQIFMSNFHSIYEFAPDGTRTTFATGLTAPLGLAFDGAGNLYVADSNSNSSNIYRYAPDGTRSTFASGLSFPFGLAFDATGNLFVGDGNNHRILEIDSNGALTTFASGFTWIADDLAFDPNGNLFVDDLTHIYKFAPDATVSTFASGLSHPLGLAFDRNGHLFEADSNSGNIFEFTPDGTRTTFASGLNGPNALAFAAQTPEPGAGGMLMVGFAGIFMLRNRIRRPR